MRLGWKGLAIGVMAGALAACSQSAPISPSTTAGGRQAVQTGNGAPSGSHYSLNIIGVSDKENMPNNLDAGHVIFVDLNGVSKIWLIEAPQNDQTFQVLDKNGTDNDGAEFQLPNPDPNGDGTTVYSVFARALGNPDGKAFMTTCAYDDGALVCSTATTLTLDASGRPPKFENVSKNLLYLYVDLDGDGNLERYPLFDDALEDYFWQYDNRGLRIAQLRFYPCSSTVPPATNPGGPTTTTCFD